MLILTLCLMSMARPCLQLLKTFFLCVCFCVLRFKQRGKITKRENKRKFPSCKKEFYYIIKGNEEQYNRNYSKVCEKSWLLFNGNTTLNSHKIALEQSKAETDLDSSVKEVNRN